MSNKKFLKEKIFPKSRSIGFRDWGDELLLVHIFKKLTLKKLILKKNRRGGLQYHHKKNECGYLVKGIFNLIVPHAIYISNPLSLSSIAIDNASID